MGIKESIMFASDESLLAELEKRLDKKENAEFRFLFISWVRRNYSVGHLFSDRQLHDWAENNFYVSILRMDE